MRTIFRFQLQDVEDGTAPPSKPILDVQVIGPHLCLDICDYDENNKHSEIRPVKGITVNVRTFLRVLYSAIAHDIEEDAMEAAEKLSR